MLSRSAKASWIEIGSSIATADSTSSRSAKASWIEIGGGQAPPAGGKSRGLRRPRGLKSSGKNGYISTVLVEVCEGLVD